MKNNLIVLGTKGGAGKSIVSMMVLPTLFAGSGKKIIVYSIDDNNTINIKSKFVDF